MQLCFFFICMNVFVSYVCRLFFRMQGYVFFVCMNVYFSYTGTFFFYTLISFRIHLCFFLDVGAFFSSAERCLFIYKLFFFIYMYDCFRLDIMFCVINMIILFFIYMCVFFQYAYACLFHRNVVFFCLRVRFFVFFLFTGTCFFVCIYVFLSFAYDVFFVCMHVSFFVWWLIYCHMHERCFSYTRYVLCSYACVMGM